MQRIRKTIAFICKGMEQFQSSNIAEPQKYFFKIYIMFNKNIKYFLQGVDYKGKAIPILIGSALPYQRNASRHYTCLAQQKKGPGPHQLGLYLPQRRLAYIGSPPAVLASRGVSSPESTSFARALVAWFRGHRHSLTGDTDSRKSATATGRSEPQLGHLIPASRTGLAQK